MSAQLLFRDKYIYADGAIREMVIWRLPKADSERRMVSNTAFFMGAPENAWFDTIMNGEKVITDMQVIRKHRMALRPLSN